ncbi:hypothetical protein STA3757_16920 [Stanieria sp. NIES-3757]|nr:hypothetical protein STA3757_16920 [Stanieria sp. NIES-3757]
MRIAINAEKINSLMRYIKGLTKDTSKLNELYSYVFETRINSEIVIKFLDDYA